MKKLINLHHAHGCNRCGRTWTCSDWVCVVGAQKRGERGKMIYENVCARCANPSDDKLEQGGTLVKEGVL